MSTSVTDETANRENKIRNAVIVIGKSRDRLKVFEAIYFKKQKIKTQKFISDRTGLTSKRVLEEGKKLATERIVKQVKDDSNKTAYEKIDFYYKNKKIIIRQVQQTLLGKSKIISHDDEKTKVNVHINIKRNKNGAKEITIDDIDSFSKISKNNKKTKPKRHPESEIKHLLQKIVGEKGKFTDWGGEINDIHTTRLIINGKRISSAFALKGSGTKPPLTIKKMGKNGDQIYRLFKSPARVFMVQFDEQIDQSTLGLMQELAENKAKDGKTIYYGIIDGTDTQRLFDAYVSKIKK